MPNPKNRFVNKKKTTLETINALIGLGLGAAEIAVLTQDTFGVIRTLQSQVMRESGMVQEKNWVCYNDNPCDFCLGMEAGNPYPLNYEVGSHPNCKCGWELE
jgi:hypothetical protein